jgi:signal transduction histidine kinase
MIKLRQHDAPGVTWIALSAGLLLLSATVEFAQPAKASLSQESARAATAVFTNISEILRLTPETADQGLPAEVEGVVTGTYGEEGLAFFVDDGQSGIYLENTHPPTPVRFAERVRVKGNTYGGSFSPMIRSSEIKKLGLGSLPKARPASYPFLAGGSADSQWLELRGVVQAVRPWPTREGVSLDFAMDGGRFEVLVDYSPVADLSGLVDAEVRLYGVASGSFNRKGQMVAPVFRVPNDSMIWVEKPAQAKCFELPVQHVKQILRFSPVARLAHRIRVRGVVTGCQPGQIIYLSDGADSLKVETSDAVDYQPGDVIDAAGFPAMSTYSPQLRNALCRRVQHQQAPRPVEPTLESVLGGLHDAQLIKLRAILVDWVADDNGVTLALQSERCLFKAYLMRAQAPADWGIEKNSQVEISGICDVKELEKEIWYYQPRSFYLLMRSAQDLTVLQKPPWLNASRLWRLVSAMALLLGTAAIWVWALRREVSRKRALLEKQAGQVAVMHERTRIARDLHDTVEQGLTGLSLQLKALETSPKNLPDQIRTDLQCARRILGNTRALTHYAVQELRQGEAVSETLKAGLERSAQFWNRTGALEVRLRFSEPAPLLPKTLEGALLTIAREAMTNAVKHGQATSIAIGVEFSSEEVFLSVKDNGRGFEPDKTGQGENGHFGLKGMSERIQEYGGQLTIRSHPGQGTEVEVKAPLARRGGSRGHPSGASAEPAAKHLVP